MESAVARVAEVGESFEIPPAEIRRSIKPGEIAKLLFWLPTTDGPFCERMWVEVTETTKAGYVGRLLNEPESPGELEAGAVIAFGPDHVAAVWDY